MFSLVCGSWVLYVNIESEVTAKARKVKRDGKALDRRQQVSGSMREGGKNRC